MKITCPNCHKNYLIPPDRYGKHVKCRCGATFCLPIPKDDLPQKPPRKGEQNGILAEIRTLAELAGYKLTRAKKERVEEHGETGAVIAEVEKWHIEISRRK